MPVKKLERPARTVTTLGLTEDECQSIQKEALRLMVHGRATCVVHELDHGRGACISIFYEQARAHIVGGCNLAYYILDPDQKLLMVSRSFGRVLKMVESLGLPERPVIGQV